MSVYSAVEGSLKIQGTVSGTDATAVRLDEPTHALKVYLTNSPSTTVIVGDVTANALVGTDGIMIISGSNFTTIQGFRPEFVAASGFLQSQIVGAGVTSLNSAGGAVLVTGTQNVSTQTSGQTITITGPDLSSFATTSLVTTTSGFLQTQIDAVEGSDVDSINSATGSISIVGEGATSVSTAGSTISVTTSPADALVGAGGITIVSGTNTTVISSVIAEALVGADGISVASGTGVITLTGFRSEFVAASGSLQSQISAGGTNEPENAIVGTDGITIISGSNTTTVQGFRSEFVAASGSLQTQITTNTNAIANLDSTYVTDAELTTVSGFLQSEIDAIVVDEVEPAITGTDGITITSGTNTTNVAGFRTEFVSASGSLQSQISSIIADEVEPAIVGTDGITIVSGSNTITVQGFRAEFVATSGSLQSQITTNTNDIANLDATYATDAHLVSVSGFLQTQIDATEGSDVDSVNAVIGNVLITGTQNTTTQTVGQTITITGPDLSSYSTTAYVDNLVTTTSGHLQTQIDAVEASDVDSINALQGDVILVGSGTTSISTSGQEIRVFSTAEQADVDSITASGTTITGSVTLEGEGATWLSVAGNTITIHSTDSGTGTGGTFSYIHTQVSPASTWNVTHNLDSENPVIQIYDTNDVVIEPDSITANSANLLTINFNQSVSGTASVLKVGGGDVMGLGNVVEDLTPQLGGDLGAQSFNITGVGTLQASTVTGTTGQFGGTVSANTGNFINLAGMSEPFNFAWTTSVTGMLVLEERAAYDYVINNLVGRTEAGTVSGTLKVNNLFVGGIENQTWDITQSIKTATSNSSVVLGDRVTFVVSGTSNGSNVGFTLNTTRG